MPLDSDTRNGARLYALPRRFWHAKEQHDAQKPKRHTRYVQRVALLNDAGLPICSRKKERRWHL